MLEKLTVRIDSDLTSYQAGMNRAVTIAKASSAKIQAGWSKLKAGAAAVGLALAVSLGVATGAGLKAFGTYEEGLNSIHTLVDATDQEMQGLGKSQRALAKEFGADIAAQLKGTYDAISAQVTDVAGATDHMRVVNKAATAGLTDQAVAGEAIIRVMRAYAKEGASASEASDFLFSVVKNGVTTFGELAPKIGNVAGLAANANLPLSELGAALATITGTANTDQAVTQLTAVLSAIIAPADGAARIADKLGINLNATALATKGLSGVVKDVQQRLGTAVDKEFLRYAQSTEDVAAITDKLAVKTGLSSAALAQLFPNVRALRGVLALMSNEGAAFAGNLEAMGDSAGAADEAYRKMARGVAHSTSKAKANLNDVAISVGEALAGPFLEFTNNLVTIAEKVTAWMAANQGLVDTLAPVILTVTAVAAAMLPLNLLMSGIGGLFGIISGAATIATGVLGGIAAVVSLLFSPFGILIALLAAVVAAFVEDMGGIGPAWDAVTSFVVETGTAVVDWFRANWPGIKKTVVDVFSAIWTAVKPVVTEVGGFIIDVFSGVLGWFRENWPLISEFFGMVWDGVREIWETLGRPLWELMRETIASVWEAIKQIVLGAGKALGGIIKAFMGLITGDWDAVWEGVKDIAVGVWEVIKGGWQLLWDTIINLMQFSGSLLTNIFTAIWDGMKEAFWSALSWIIDKWNGFVDLIGDAWDWIVGGSESATGGGGSSGPRTANQGSPGNRFGKVFGGLIGGPAGLDTVPINATRGEYMVDVGTTDYFGASFFRGLQKIAHGDGDAGTTLNAGGITFQIDGGADPETIVDQIMDRLDSLSRTGSRDRFRRGDR